MNYKILKLEFTTAVHFGGGGLEKGQNVLNADTLFSVLFIEALKYGESDRLLDICKSGKLKISNAFPYIGKEYYLPKPIIRLDNDNDGDSIRKKALKKLRYIPLSKFESFINGKLNIEEESDSFGKKFGEFTLLEKVSMLTSGENDVNNLYAVEVFKYKKGSGLYLFIGFEDEKDFEMVKRLMNSISYTGIGGKISSGYGKYVLCEDTPNSNIVKKFEDIGDYKDIMSLSLCLPNEDELKKSLEDASYTVVKRSGFIASSKYADTYRKKKDLYMLEVGSVYKNIFEGDIYDVSGKNKGTHPVYRYGKPFFMGVR
ncbi:type III-A CRISPR-associated RAMP protein Csm4 [Lachnoanaerobaculum umeaense]|jgi:CRISPR-associated RAMP protein, csm4 family|uniref:CRISPR system Cms protein Csm4 n=1 Tax=Lachnoanaerobaculum umeaense TaxID=617123 RepID=A0A385Q1Y8_9FIRM|nr:type III-A CRISPR-associated RAMP protein Csm4 [Lachnoanaerobaculum umeaense]AYB00353.1 type III-A CRISPR-associated RAMP protein Csm4 [Lachnoanaerobaculum umeaense]PZW99889.1 CRISPR-associated protein Csm4 [Lachnoanaerobaculum umeaense]